MRINNNNTQYPAHDLVNASIAASYLHTASPVHVGDEVPMKLICDLYLPLTTPGASLKEVTQRRTKLGVLVFNTSRPNSTTTVSMNRVKC